MMKQLEKDLANNKLPNNFTNGYNVNVNGYNITVRGVVVNGKPQIGTAFIP